MPKHKMIIAVASILIAGVVAASAINAQDHHGSIGSMMGQGMMGRGGMMGMMGSMGQMMENCASMMQGMTDSPGSRRPNEQWRKAPSAPGEKN